MKTRFCPSPTGHIHLGNARTALFNALLSKSKKGHFLIRIEDTDQVRSTDEFSNDLIEDLEWLGIKWDEGPKVGGNEGPYKQSERHAIYEKYYQELEKKGLLYPCFCTEQQLAIARKLQLSVGKPPRYSGTCSQLTPEQIQQNLNQGLKPAWRFRVPENQLITFIDLVKGEQNFSTQAIGDFIIRRADKSASFLFSNAIDDALMEVTHALRGDDHLNNTPRQLLITQALNLKSPIYGHIALILGPDHSPLSKRNGSRSIRELREDGFLPEAINNYMARLGHYYEHVFFMDFDELAERFDMDGLATSPAHYDYQQLLRWQKEAITRQSNDFIWTWIGPQVEKIVPKEAHNDFIETVKTNITFPEEGLYWARIIFQDKVEMEPPDLEHIQKAGHLFFREALSALVNHGSDYQGMIQGIQDSTGKKGKELYYPLRVALTGVSHGPELVPLMKLLGHDEIQKRLNHCYMLISQ